MKLEEAIKIFKHMNKDKYVYKDPIRQKINESIDVIIKVLTPPTDQEVCEVLSEYFNEHAYYENYQFDLVKSDATTKRIVTLINDELLFNIHYTLPPHLITLIGRFYEGLEATNE